MDNKKTMADSLTKKKKAKPRAHNKKTMADSMTEEKKAKLRAHNKKTMAASLSEERKAELREAFFRFDSNKDGLITIGELEAGMR